MIKTFDMSRQMVAYKTSQAWQEIPHVAFNYEPDVTEFLEVFQNLKTIFAKENRKLSLNTMLIKVIVEGLKKAKELNAYLNYDSKTCYGQLEIKETIDIDIPWLFPDGHMMTITAFDLEHKTLRQIADQIADIQNKVIATDFDRLLEAIMTQNLDKLLTYGLFPKDIASGTVTVSNLGSICKTNGSLALLEIIPPQVFAIGIASTQEKPGVYHNQNGTKEIGIRQYLPMSLTFDHRAFDFGDIVPFIERLDDIFQNPSEIYHW